MPFEDTFYRSFLAGFRPTYYSTLNNEFKKQRIEEKRAYEESERLKKEQTNQKILGDLLDTNKRIYKPGSDEFTHMPPKLNMKTGEFKEQGRNSIEDLLSYAKLSREYQTAYDYATKPEKVEKQNTVTFDGKIYLEDPNVKGLPTGEPRYQKEEKQKETYLWDEPIGDGKLRTVYGYEDEKGNYSKEDKKYTITRKTTPFKIYDTKNDSNGNLTTTLSKDTLKLFKDFNYKQQELSSKLELS